MPRRKLDYLAISLALIALLLVSLPYLIAFQSGGEQYQFGGFLLNPLDGNTYLAKMMEGWQGQWRFTLAYTAEPGRGAYLYTAYLFLGHLARWSGLSNLLLFHAARLAGAAFLFYCLYRFYRASLPSLRTTRLAYALALFGSGLGWFAAAAGVFTSDFWVAEAYPFLSAYASPHFAFGLGLVAWLLTPRPAQRLGAEGIKSLLAALLLANLMPFGVVIVAVTLGGLLLASAWKAFAARPSQFLRRLLPALDHRLLVRFLAVGLGGGAVLLYQLQAITSDPLLSGWNAQNQTPSPLIGDLLLSFSPALLLALLAIALSASPHPRVSMSPLPPDTASPCLQNPVLLAWTLAALLLLLLPFNLQRRFISGLFIPIAGLAAVGVERLAGSNTRRFRIWSTGLLILSLPTNLLVISAGLSGASAHDPRLYLASSEALALGWLREQAPAGSVVLASPEMGLFIPAYSSCRVIYGHPFETVDAAAQRERVVRFFQGEIDAQLLAAADYIFYGPRERALGELAVPPEWTAVFHDASVTIYRVRSP